MATDSAEVEILCRETGLSNAVISSVLASSEEAKLLLKSISEYVVKEKNEKDKLATNMQNFRRARVNADQQFNQLEKQLISCNSKLEHEAKSNEVLKKHLDETVEALELKSKKLSEVESIKEDAVTKYSTISSQNATLEAEKLNLITTLERKNQEIDRLNGEWKSMHEKISNANALQCEAKAKLDELTSKETSYQLREKRLEQEKDLLIKQKDWFESQLKEKSEAYFSQKKEHSANIARLQTSLDAKIDEAKNLESLSENLKTDNEDLRVTMNSLVDKLKEAREHHSKTEEQYKLEIASQSKLAMLYKDTSESSKAKCDELVSAVEELQTLLKEANNGRVEVESKLAESETNLDKVIKDYDEKVQSLEHELKNANDLLEAARLRGTAPMSAESLAALSPTAAATSSFLKSGMTLTQIYNQYVETLDSLEIEKAENGRLKGYLEDILKDIEEKAPLLQQQRKDYEGALITIDNLTMKLEDAMKEMEKFSMEISEAVQKSEHLKRENERMKILTADLASQVKILLKECEEARGSVVSTTSSIGLDDLTQSYNEVSSSSEVISKRLVTFRNIEELQEQNQRLLTVIRELSEEKEQEEKREKNNSAHAELKQQLDDALQELEELKESRERQTSMVEAVIRQRDMYRVLLTNSGQSPITPRQVLDQSQNVKDQSAASSEETREALKELQKQFESYKNERLSSEKVIKNKNEELQSTISELNVKNATTVSQLEHANEKYKLLESNCSGLKREATALREKSDKLSLSCAKLETSYETAKQELSEVKEKLMKSEVMYQNLVEEKNIIKQAETRLVEENKSLINQQKGQNTLLTNLQTIQNNLERQEYETRSRLTGQIDGLEQEVTVLKQKLTSQQEQNAKLVESLQSQVAEAKRKLDSESESLKEAENQVEILRSELDNVKLKLSEKESHLSASETRMDEILARNANEDQENEFARALKEKEEEFSLIVNELKGKLYETESRNKVLENQVGLTKKHLDQYKAMLAGNEEALTELNKTSKLYQEKAESEKEETEKVMAVLQETLTSTQMKITSISTENAKLKKQLTEETASLHKSVEILTSEAKEAVKRAEICIEKEKRANEICEEQKALATETQEKYQKELVHHASDVQSLTAAKEQLETFESRLAETEEKWKVAVNNLNECKASWEEQKRLHGEELGKLVSRCEELASQNTLLHEQGEKLSEQVLAAQSRSVSDIRISSEVTDDTPVDKTVKDLWEVIRFVRKEKEIAETKSELLQSESMRYQQRLEYVEKQLEDTEQVLEKEKQRTKSLPVDIAEHEEIMKKVELLAEVEEMNKVLTTEKEALQNKVIQTEAEVKRLESDIGPLKQNINGLTAQKDMLVGEKTALKSEIQRWRTRVNLLAEQSKNKADLEEVKKLQEEKKQLITQQKSTADEAQKLKVKVDAMRNEITRLQAEINVKKNEITKVQEELKSLKSENNSASTKFQEEKENLQKELGTKTEEIQEKAKMITKLKSIAKRYKTQYDETLAQKEELNKKLSEEQPTADTSKQDDMIKTLNEEKKSLQEEIEKLNQSLTTGKEREEKVKKTLNSATKRIQQLMTMKDKYSNECEELKKSIEKLNQEKDALSVASSEREMRLTVLSTQFEGKHARMEKELKEKNEFIEKYEQEKNESKERETEKESEMEKLKKKLQQYERVMRQAQQKIKSQASQLQALGNVSSTTVTSGSEDTTVPPTAAVKPTATPSNTAPVRSQVTPTASIRPMTSGTVQATPRATVPPTVTTQPTVPPTATTQPTVPSTVIPQPTVIAEPITTSSVRTQPPPTVHPLPSTPVSSAMTSEVTAVSVRPIVSTTVITMATSGDERPSDIVSDERPSTSTQGQSTEQSSVDDDATSRENVDGRSGIKRPRDNESSTDQPLSLHDAKKSKTEVQEEVSEVTEAVDEDDVLDVMADDENIDEEDKQEDVEREVVCIDDESDEDEVKVDIEEQIEADDIDDDDDDVVEVIDDDEDDDVDVDDDIDMKEEFVDEAITEQSEVPEESADNASAVNPTADTTSQEQHSQDSALTSHSVRTVTQPPFIRSQSHLAPFTLSQAQTSSGGFDETDDCMVPSTPTLFIPKRSDGFSEMISSPRVQHPSFLFGSTSESSLTQTGGLAMGMTEEGLRVDDTRFDIMASSGDGDEADLGFDNVVPDLDEASTIEFTSEDDLLDPPTMVPGALGSASVDISEQNVPETGEKYDAAEITEIVAVDSKTPDEVVTSQLEQKTEVKDCEEASSSLNKPVEQRQDSSKEIESQGSSSAEPSTSTGKTRITITSQESRPKSTVVQLRRPLGQTTSSGQTQSGQTARGRRQIRRVQASTRGLQRRGRGQSHPENQ